MAETEKRILLLESRIVGAEQLAFLAEMFKKAGKEADEASLKLPKIEAANREAMKAVEEFNKRLQKNEVALAALPRQIELYRNELSRVGDNPRMVEAYTKKIEELDRALAEANASLSRTEGSMSGLGGAAQLADTQFDKLMQSAANTIAATESLPLVIDRLENELRKMAQAGQEGSAMFALISREVDSVKKRLADYSAQVQAAASATNSLDDVGANVADEFARLEKSVGSAEKELTVLPQLISMIEGKMAALAAAGKEGSTEFVRWLNTLGATKDKLAAQEAVLAKTVNSMGQLDPVAQAAADIMGKLAGNMTRVETEAKAIPIALAQITAQMQAMEAAGKATGPVFAQLLKDRDRLIARQAELSNLPAPTAPGDAATREMDRFSKSLDDAVNSAESLADKSALVQSKLDALAAEGKQGSAAFQALTRELQSVQKAISTLSASGGRTGAGGIADEASLAEKSMRGWMDSMRQAEATLSTLQAKIDIAKQKIAELEAQGKRGSAAWVAYKSALLGLEDAQAKFTKASQGNTASLKEQRYALQNVSYQLTDVVVQAQAGTNAMTIIAQQGPQLLAGFGAAGAAAGLVLALAAAIGGPLMAALNGSKATLDTVSEKIGNLGDSLGRIGKISNDLDLSEFAKKYVAASAVGQDALRDLFQVWVQGTAIASRMAITELDKYNTKLAELSKLQMVFAWVKGLAADILAPQVKQFANLASAVGIADDSLLKFSASLDRIKDRTFAQRSEVERLSDAMAEYGVKTSLIDDWVKRSGRAPEDGVRVMAFLEQQYNKASQILNDTQRNARDMSDEAFTQSRTEAEAMLITLEKFGANGKALASIREGFELVTKLREALRLGRMSAAEFDAEMSRIAASGSKAGGTIDHFAVLMSRLSLEEEKNGKETSELTKLTIQFNDALMKLTATQKAKAMEAINRIAEQRELQKEVAITEKFLDKLDYTRPFIRMQEELKKAKGLTEEQRKALAKLIDDEKARANPLAQRSQALLDALDYKRPFQREIDGLKELEGQAGITAKEIADRTAQIKKAMADADPNQRKVDAWLGMIDGAKQYTDQLAELEKIGRANKYMSPEDYDKVAAKLKRLADESVPSLANAFNDLAKNTMTDFFQSIGTAEWDFDQFAKSFIANTLKMIAQMETLRYLNKTFQWGDEVKGKSIWEVIGGIKDWLTPSGKGFSAGVSVPELGARMPGVALLESAPVQAVYSSSAIPASNLRTRRDAGGINVQVINNTPSEIKTERNDDGSLKILVNQVKQSIMGDISRGGNPMARTFESSYALGRATR